MHFLCNSVPKYVMMCNFFYMVKMCKQVRKQLVFMGKIMIQPLHWRTFGTNQKMLQFLRVKSVSKFCGVHFGLQHYSKDFRYKISKCCKIVVLLPRKVMAREFPEQSLQSRPSRKIQAILKINPPQLKNPGPITIIGEWFQKE